MNMRYLRHKFVTLAALTALSVPLWAQEIPTEGPATTTALINAQSKNETPLDPSQLKLEVNGHKTPIGGVQPVRSGAPQIAILIDDGLRGSFGLQLDQIRQFLTELPATTQVTVGYMQNGTVRQLGRGFTTDHAALASQLRIPLSSPGVSASPYFCLSDFVNHWPSSQPGPRFVLMITNGVDPYNGSVSPMNQDSPYVQTAQDDAQRAGVAVYSIYYGDRAERGRMVAFSGSSYLSQVAEATGGQLLNEGPIAPVDFKPFLNQFNHAIAESYVVSFQANATREKGNTLDRIKLTTSQPGVKIHAPQGVHPGLVE
jgi:hypothetical protein